MAIDFDGLAASLLANARAHLESWLPAGKWHGHEYRVGDISGAPGGSLSINSQTGVWKDFAGGPAGADLVSLYAAIHGIGQAEAARQLGGNGDATVSRRGNGGNGRNPSAQNHPETPSTSTELRLTAPPAGTQPPDFGDAVATWPYLDAVGAVVWYLSRHNMASGKKRFVPYSWADGYGWVNKHQPAPRGLFGLDLLAARPDAPVMVVEGEGKCLAARQITGKVYVVVAWPGGAQSHGKADFSPLAGRAVLLWPDADTPGVEAMAAIGQRLLAMGCPTVKLLDVSGQPDGWDAADAFSEGWNWAQFKVWATPRLSLVVAVAPATEGKGNEPPPPMPLYEPPISFPGTPEGYGTPWHGEEAWSEPVDLFRPYVLPDLRPEWLPKVIADFAFDQAEVIGCDPAIVAASAITCCAGAASAAIKVQPHSNNYGWTESPRIWTAIVGDVSAKKSPGMGAASSHLRKMDIGLFKVEEAAKKKYALERRIYESMEKKYIEAQSKGGGGGEPIEPAAPVIDRLIVEDVTVEAMRDVLKHNPRGVLLYADELAGWLGSMDAYKKTSSDRAHWLSAYDSKPRRIDRVGSGSVLVPCWSACILGGIQPDTLQRALKDVPEDGLLQRFMPIVAKRGGHGLNQAKKGRCIAAYSESLERIFAMGTSDRHISLSPEAEEIHSSIITFSEQLNDSSVISPAMLAWLGKWEGLSPRLMLIFHLIECAAAGETHHRPISEATAERVMYYMQSFLFRHGLVFYDTTIIESSVIDAVRWVGGFVLAHKMTVLANRDLLQNFAWWKKARDWERAQVFSMLIDLGWARPKNAKDRFKTMPTQLEINPLVHVVFKEKGALESLRRSAAKEALIEAKREYLENSISRQQKSTSA